MTTFWCAPLLRQLGYNNTIIDMAVPFKNFVKGVISSTSPHADGNYIESHKDQIMKAKPGSRYGTAIVTSMEIIT